MPHVREKCKGVFVIRQTYREKRGVATKRVDSDSRGYGMFFTSRAEAIKKAYKFRVLVELGRKPKRHDAEASSRGDTASLDASIITPSVSFTSVDYGVAGPPAEAAPPTPQSKRKEKVEKVHRDRRATNTAKQKKAIAEATRRATRREHELQSEATYCQEQVASLEEGMRKKTDGPGEMVSGFTCEALGFGIPLNDDELRRVNEYRAARGRAALTASPGIAYFEYGKAKEGYWKFENFAEQCVDVMDVFETMYPYRQLIIEVDHSAGHGAHEPGGLYTADMNVMWGGKQYTPRPSTLTALDLGPVTATYGPQLGPGDVQHFDFQPGDPPPFYEPNAPKQDVKGRIVLPNGQTKEINQHGYIGKPKGMRQIAWERGLWRPGMVEADLSEALNKCHDFATQKTALEKLVADRGHILLMSPKGHCEVAGLGIEYAWGVAKRYFRRHNDVVAKHLHDNVVKALSPDVLTLRRCRMFARRAREYKRAYAHPDAASFVDVEKLKEVAKSHRSALDFDTGFIDNMEV